MASPEAIKAQRQADLKGIAEWRQRKLHAYQDWADPVKREAIQMQAKMDLSEACMIARERQDADPHYMESLMNRKDVKMAFNPETGKNEQAEPIFAKLEDRIKITPKAAPIVPPKLAWYQKILNWFLAGMERIGY